MRHRSVGLAILPTLAVALGWFAVVVVPSGSEAADLDRRLEVVDADVQNLSSTIAATQELEAEIAGLQAERTALEQAVPETVDLAGIVRLIDREAEESGMSVALVSPQARAQEESPDEEGSITGSFTGVGSIDVEVTGSATYSELIAFVHGLTTNERFVMVKSLGLEGGRVTGRLEVTLTIEVFSSTTAGTAATEPSDVLAFDESVGSGEGDATLEAVVSE